MKAATGGGSYRWRQLQVEAATVGGSFMWRQLQVEAASGGGSFRWGQLQVEAASGGGSYRWRQLQVGAATGGGSYRWRQLQVEVDTGVEEVGSGGGSYRFCVRFRLDQTRQMTQRGKALNPKPEMDGIHHHEKKQLLIKAATLFSLSGDWGNPHCCEASQFMKACTLCRIRSASRGIHTIWELLSASRGACTAKEPLSKLRSLRCSRALQRTMSRWMILLAWR
eukprot:366149-Chlamydomonas_euryale.AAC.9